jgi:acyl-CoA dehydrogenase family protein 9
VPAANVIGEPGRGFKIAVEILNTGRLSLAAGCVGGIKVADPQGARARRDAPPVRRPIVEFEMLKEKFAEMAVDAFALESMVYLAAGLHDRKLDASLEAAICKIFGTEALWRATNHAVQVAGGTGFMREYPYERAVRDARVNMIFEGTNEILRVLISPDRHAEARRVSARRSARRSRVRSRTRACWASTRRDACAARSSRSGSGSSTTRCADQAARSKPRPPSSPDRSRPSIRRERSHIVEREYLQRRLADAAIDLYAMLATLLARLGLDQGARAGSGGGGDPHGARVLRRGVARVRRNVRSRRDQPRRRISTRSSQGCASGRGTSRARELESGARLRGFPATLTNTSSWPRIPA